MKIRIMENERKFDEAAAWIIIGQMLKKPDSVIGLPIVISITQGFTSIPKAKS